MALMQHATAMDSGEPGDIGDNSGPLTKPEEENEFRIEDLGLGDIDGIASAVGGTDDIAIGESGSGVLYSAVLLNFIYSY